MFAVSNCDTLALRMAERGDASMADIDIAMKLGAGYPMGYVNIIRFHAQVQVLRMVRYMK